MASNNLIDLKNMMFNELVRLDDDELSPRKMAHEIDRGLAMAKVSENIVHIARVCLDAAQQTGRPIDDKQSIPHQLLGDELRTKHYE